MLVTNTLLVDLHAGYSQYSVLLAEPSGIQLAVRDNPKEDASQYNGQETSNQEDNLPGLDRRSMLRGTDCDSIGDKAAQDLTHAVEAEPDVDSASLLFLGVPLDESLALVS